MHVTVTRTKGSPDQSLEIATIAGEEMLPWLREIDGFDGLLMLTNEEAATTLVMTFWENREVAERHRAARTEFRERVTATVNVNIEETSDYEVSFAHLGPRLSELQR
jgi:heme-degrading monooxygenase HmoA